MSPNLVAKFFGGKIFQQNGDGLGSFISKSSLKMWGKQEPKMYSILVSNAQISLASGAELTTHENYKQINFSLIRFLAILTIARYVAKFGGQIFFW